MISCRFTLSHKVSVKVKKCLCQTCVLSPDVSGSSVPTKIHYSYWVRASLMCIVIIMKVPWCSLNSTALGNVKASSLFLHCELKIKLNYTQEVNCWQDTVYSVVVMGTGAQSAFHSKHICISVAGAFFVTFSFTLLYQLVLLQIYVLDRGNSWMTISSNHVWSDHVAANDVDLHQTNIDLICTVCEIFDHQRWCMWKSHMHHKCDTLGLLFFRSAIGSLCCNK